MRATPSDGSAILLSALGSQTLNELLIDLAEAYPKQRAQFGPATFKVYLEDLSDLPIEAVEAATKNLRRSSDWFPTINQIREQAAEIALGLPGEATALAQIEQRMRWARGNRDETPPELHPVAKEALDLVGGAFAFKSADEPSVIRGQFLRLYRDLRVQAIREMQVGAPALQSGRLQLPEVASD